MDNLPKNVAYVAPSHYIATKKGNYTVEELTTKMERNELLVDMYDPFLGPPFVPYAQPTSIKPLKSMMPSSAPSSY